MPAVILLLCFIAFIVAVESNQHQTSDRRAGNYHWASKILGQNDKNFDHPMNVHMIFEIGSRDLLDGNCLADFFNATVYSFEANPYNFETMENNQVDERVHIVKSAVSKKDGTLSFLAMNLTKYNNAGAGSLHEADYVTKRNPSDPDYNITNPQIPVVANSTRLDTFIQNKLHNKVPDMICMDCQESELEALQSAGDLLRQVKYIVFEANSVPAYKNGNSYKDVHLYLDSMGFKFWALKKQSGSKRSAIRFVVPTNYIVDNNDGADFLYINKNVKLS